MLSTSHQATFFFLSCSSCLRGLFLLLLVLAAPSMAACQEATRTVRLTIDYGDGVEKSFTALPWKEKLTVFGALEAAAQHSRGIRVAHSGSGETTFVTAIDDLANAGAGGANWRYEVNGQRGSVSAGVFEVKANDAVVWRFAK